MQMSHLQDQTEFVTRVKRAFNEHIRPDIGYDEGSDDSAFQEAQLACKRHYDKLPFNNVNDAGARYEAYLLAAHEHGQQLPTLPAGAEQPEQRQRVAALRREELREAAWLAAGQHGFAALAGLPELQAIVSHTCLPVLEQLVSLDVRVHCGDEEGASLLQQRCRHEDTALLPHLSPQLLACLLAEVAVGLLVPGQPLPPDTPEHGAVLQAAVSLGFTDAMQEAADDSSEYLDERWGNCVKQCSDVLHAHAEQQLAVPGHELLELLCQLMDSGSQQQQGRSTEGSSSREGGSSSSSGSIEDAVGEGSAGSTGSRGADDDRSYDSSSSSRQMQALSQLVGQWQPSMDLCKHLQQQQQQQQEVQPPDNSSSSSAVSSAQLMSSLCAQACAEVVALAFSEAVTAPGDAQQLQQQEAPASAAALVGSVLSSAAAAPQLFRQQNEQHLQQRELQQQPVELETRQMHVEQQLPSHAVAEQLRVLGGGLVLQFVSAARAAGGPAWQQEVPLQAVLLLGALEQLQGLALAAVQQQDVQEAAAAAAATQQQEQQQVTQQQEQQQQQQQQEVPAKGLLLLVQKLLDIIQLTRQFAQLNAALNSSSSSAAGTSSSKAASSSSSSSVQPLSCEQLFSPGGPAHALYTEPATLGAWTQPTAAAAAAAAAGTGSGTDGCSGGHAAVDVNSINGIDQQEQQQEQDCQHLPAALEQPPAASSSKSSKRQPSSSQDAGKQLRRAAVSGALLLFSAQHKAQSSAIKQWRHDKQQGRPPGYSGQAELLLMLQEIQQKAQLLGIEAPDEGVMRLLRVGSAQLAEYRAEYEQQLEAQGLDPCWATPQDAAEDEGPDGGSSSSEVANGGSSSRTGIAGSSSSKKVVGRTYGVHGAASAGSTNGKGNTMFISGRSSTDEDEQQQEAAGLASAVKLAGRSVMKLLAPLQSSQQQPALRFLDQWATERQRLRLQAAKWWQQHMAGTAANPSQHSSSKQHGVTAANGGLYSSMNSTLKGVMSWASGGWQGGTGKHGSSNDSSRSSSACPLCQQEQLTTEDAAADTAADGAAGAATSSPCSAAGGCRDPFMWRRLVWQLLGRLKPSAQAWYVTHYAMCPHCPERRLWRMIAESLGQCLWVPLDPDCLSRSLVHHVYGNPHSGQLRTRHALQYARALNDAFAESYNECGYSATMLSLQVLLPLSPLHQQLLPLQEQLPLFPASFGPAVDKLLMSQLGLRQLLQREVKHAGQPLMWHVWWHIGVRRFHWVKQQQEQDDDSAGDSSQQQQQQNASAVSRSSKVRSKQRARKQQQQQQAQAAAQQAGLQPLSAGQLAALYADPAARYYAAGFAARQTAAYGTGMRARAALRASHLAPSHSLWLAVSADRIQMLMSGQGSSIGVEGYGKLRTLLRMACDVQYEHEHAQSRPLFPPLLRPELQLGVSEANCLPSQRIATEAGLRHRAGELLQLVAGSAMQQALEMHPRAWLMLHERMMPGCDCCSKTLHKGRLEGEGESDDSSDDERGRVVMLTCEHCCVPNYCSSACLDLDEPHHMRLCPRLRAAQQRYSAAVKPLQGHSSSLSPATATAARHCWRVLQLLQPEPGPLGMDCQALG